MNDSPGFCHCCESKNIVEIEYEDNEFHVEVGSEIFNGRRLFHCSECRFSFSFPFIEDAALKKFYAEGYWIRGGVKELAFASMDQCFSQIATAFNLLGYPPSDILEIGGGTGQLFHSVQTLFKDRKFNFFALEAENEKYRGLLKKQGFRVLDDLTRKEDMDLIFSSHTLEHFNANSLEPFLDSCRQTLRDGGLMFVEVPLDDFSDFVGKSKINEGCHLVHYTKDSLKQLFSKQFEIIFLEEFSDGNPRVFTDGSPETFRQQWNLPDNPSFFFRFKRFLKKKLPFAVLWIRSSKNALRNRKNKLLTALLPKNHTIISLKNISLPVRTKGSHLRLVARKKTV